MKTEHQSMIESIRECLPLNDCLIDFDDNPLRFEKMFPGSITFLDGQKGDRNFIHSFMTQADISRMSSDCDLVPLHRRQSSTNSSCDGQSSILSIRAMLHEKRMKDMLSGWSNTCLNSRTNRLVEAVKTSVDDNSTIQRLDEHLSSDCKYNAFKFSNTSNNDKLTLSSSCTSIRDRARYQACDRSGTYSKETYEFCSMLMYKYIEYEIHHGRNPVNDNVLLNHHPMWREQFDHVSKDFYRP